MYSLTGNTLHEKTTLEHNGALTSIKYSPNGSLLASGDTYRKVLLYQLPDYTVCSVISSLIYYYIRQVNGVKPAEIMFSLLCVCVSVCAHSVQFKL